MIPYHTIPLRGGVLVGGVLGMWLLFKGSLGSEECGMRNEDYG